MGIIHTGNWEWRSGFDSSATPSGDCASNPGTCTSFWYGTLGSPTVWGFGYDGFTHLSLAAGGGTLTFDWSNTGLFLDGVFQDPQFLPAGFRVHDAYVFSFTATGPPPASNMHLNVEFQALQIDEDIDDFDGPQVYNREFSGFGDNSTINLLVWRSIGGWPFIFTADHPAYPTWPGGNFQIPTASGAPLFSGQFDIIYWWWKLPDVTACGDRNTRSPTDSDSHLVYAGDQPPTPDGAFGEFEKLDPDDYDAAPTPVILNVDPNHGRSGTAVNIYGEGFGDDANVQFDGVDADSIVVHSQYWISCVAPAHANGFANIAVINPDGVST